MTTTQTTLSLRQLVALLPTIGSGVHYAGHRYLPLILTSSGPRQFDNTLYAEAARCDAYKAETAAKETSSGQPFIPGVAQQRAKKKDHKKHANITTTDVMADRATLIEKAASSVFGSLFMYDEMGTNFLRAIGNIRDFGNYASRIDGLIASTRSDTVIRASSGGANIITSTAAVKGIIACTSVSPDTIVAKLTELVKRSGILDGCFAYIPGLDEPGSVAVADIERILRDVREKSATPIRADTAAVDRWVEAKVAYLESINAPSVTLEYGRLRALLRALLVTNAVYLRPDEAINDRQVTVTDADVLSLSSAMDEVVNLNYPGIATYAARSERELNKAANNLERNKAPMLQRLVKACLKSKCGVLGVSRALRDHQLSEKNIQALVDEFPDSVKLVEGFLRPGERSRIKLGIHLTSSELAKHAADWMAENHESATDDYLIAALRALQGEFGGFDPVAFTKLPECLRSEANLKRAAGFLPSDVSVISRRRLVFRKDRDGHQVDLERVDADLGHTVKRWDYLDQLEDAGTPAYFLHYDSGAIFLSPEQLEAGEPEDYLPWMQDEDFISYQDFTAKEQKLGESMEAKRKEALRAFINEFYHPELHGPTFGVTIPVERACLTSSDNPE